MLDILKGILDKIFNANYAQDILNILKNSNGINPNVQLLVDNISTAIIPLGLSLVVMFWLIEFLQLQLNFHKNITWERIALLIIKLIIAKYLVQGSAKIMDLLSYISQSVLDVVSQPNIDPTVSISEAIDDIFKNYHNDILKQLGLIVQLLPFTLIMNLLGTLATAIIYVRGIEIVSYTAFAPIPISTIMFDGVRDMGKRFLQAYLAVCFQGVIIIIIIYVYSAMFNPGNPPSDGVGLVTQTIGYISSTLVLIISLFKSGSWANRILGLS